MKQIVTDMPNEVYHHAKETGSYISSTQLKDYAVSPAYAKYMREHPELREETPSMRLGTQLHGIMQQLVEGKTFDEIEATFAVYMPPINPKTGAPYGETTVKYQEGYQEFLAASDGKTIITQANLDKIMCMAKAICEHPLNRTLIDYARPQENFLKGAEISFFTEVEEGIGIKCRVDEITSSKIVDWKSTSGSLDPDSLTSTILKFDYDVSASLYQYILYKITGSFYRFYWVFTRNCEPYEATVPVSAENFAFATEEDMMTFINDVDCQLQFNRGPMKMRALLNEHIYCTKNDVWPGSEVFVEPNASEERVLAPVCPSWALTKVPKFFN